jgi:hypothetical protein
MSHTSALITGAPVDFSRQQQAKSWNEVLGNVLKWSGGQNAEKTQQPLSTAPTYSSTPTGSPASSGSSSSTGGDTSPKEVAKPLKSGDLQYMTLTFFILVIPALLLYITSFLYKQRIRSFKSFIIRYICTIPYLLVYGVLFYYFEMENYISDGWVFYSYSFFLSL